MQALILIDYINEITDSRGKLSGKGYADFIKKYNTIESVNNTLEGARKNNDKIIFVKLGFDSQYSNWNEKSPLFGVAKQYGALQKDTWATQIDSRINVEAEDVQIYKSRVSAFFGNRFRGYSTKK